MKILHTSDWHLGHSLYNFDRTEEQAAMLRQMAELVADHKPDVFLLSGDVYHTPQPSAAVQTLFTEALVTIHDACPSMTIVITAGNHDSSSKHDIFRTPWRALKVYTIGSIDREHLDAHIVELPGKGFVVAVPFASERNMPEGFFQQLLDRVAERNTEGLPVVMSAHTTVRGCDFTGHESATEYTVGGIDCFGIEQMGEGYDYLALGHIHHGQFIHTGRHNVRYCGTPLPVSFDEQYPHTVSIVTLGRHGDTPSVEEVPIENPHPLVTLPVEGFAPWDEAKELLAAYPDEIAAYIRLNVEIDDYLPAESMAEARRLAEGKQCRLCHINARRKAVLNDEARTLSVQEFQSAEPIDIATRYAQDTGKTFDDEMKALFNEALLAVLNDQQC